jgi:hypothetical protein
MGRQRLGRPMGRRGLVLRRVLKRSCTALHGKYSIRNTSSSHMNMLAEVKHGLKEQVQHVAAVGLAWR